MNWLTDLVLPTPSVNSLQTIILIFFIISVGTFLGKLQWRGISIGTAAIMFVGLLMGHLGYHIETHVADFLRDFGIILFLYVLGLQVGPFFFSSFQKQGLLYNMFALITVLIGVLVSVVIYFVSGYRGDTIVGLMSGAVTNTPGLGAAQNVLQEMSAYQNIVFTDLASAYAIGYPIGVLGIILVIALSKFLLRVDVSREIEEYTKTEQQNTQNIPQVLRCKVQNPQLDGKSLFDIFDILGNETISISRIRRAGSNTIEVPDKNTHFYIGDDVVIVGLEKDLKRVQPLFGEVIDDLSIEENPSVLTRTFFVTRKAILEKPLEVSTVQSLYGVKITRITRGNVQFVVNSQNRLLFGDSIVAVGKENDLRSLETLVGNNKKYLTESNLLLLAIGLILGVIIGSIPFFVPGLSTPLKLGVAAGSLLVALLISRYAPSFGISVYMNEGSASFLKDLGISFFFAVVGLKAGAHFYETFVDNNGWMWLFFAFCITVIPLFIMLFVGFYLLKIRFLPLIGLLSASYTDSIALLFSINYLKTEIPNHAYVLSYPIANIIRIIAAQILILFLI